MNQHQNERVRREEKITKVSLLVKFCGLLSETINVVDEIVRESDDVQEDKIYR